MNQSSSRESSVSSPTGIDLVSRRAYEIWEQEGRPEGCDLRHWLQAEQECAVASSTIGSRSDTKPPSATNTGSDVRPLQGTRAAAAASREPKQGSNAPFSGRNRPRQAKSVRGSQTSRCTHIGGWMVNSVPCLA